MNKTFKRLGLALVGMGAIGGLFTLPASAQSADPNQALPGLGSSDQQNDPLSGTDGLNMYDLFHRLQMGPLPSMSEFNREQQRTINSAASDFRTRQLERLRQQNPQTPQAAPVAPPTSPQPQINTLPQS